MFEEKLEKAKQIELKSSMKYIKSKVYVLESVGSTNEFLLKVNKIPSGTVVVAKTQTSGRGRKGTNWHSSKGGLWFSVAFDPDELLQIDSIERTQSQRIKGINLASALAVTRALSKTNIQNAKIKWPNDVYLEELKICGILSQSRFEVNNNRIVVGFGLNVNQKSSDFPPELRQKAGSLHSITGITFKIMSVLEKILVEFNALLYEIIVTGMRYICDEINKHSLLNHKNVTLKHGTEVYTGKVIKIDDDGSLVLDIVDNDRENYSSFSEQYGEFNKNIRNFYAGEITEF